MSFHPNKIARRGRIATIGVIAVFGLLVARFFSMQILLHAQYVLQSDKNRLNEVPLPAPRGIIYDRTGAIIAENVPGYTVSILAAREDSLVATVGRIASLVPVGERQMNSVVRRRKLNPNRPALLLSDASFGVVSVLEEHRIEFPGLIIQSAPKRHYPDSTAVSGFVGYTGEISESQLADDKELGYKSGQQIGKAGLELEYEAELRGQEGSRFVEVDAKGRVVRNAGVRAELAPIAGPSLHTNIDLDLQRFIAKLFGDSLVGAAIVLEPNTGAVLALHSAPSYDPNRFIGGVSTEYYESMKHDSAEVNKAFMGLYEPGSTFKLATAIIGLEEGKVRLDDHMPEPCTGSYLFGDRIWHCDNRDGHGSLNLLRAIEVSCDIYFYQLGIKIGFRNLVREANSMMFGDTTGIDLPNEQKPSFPPVADSEVTAYYRRLHGSSWTRASEALNLSIGQGANAQTVVNMARFYTALATDGQAARPRVAQGDVMRKRLFQIDSVQLDSLRLAMTRVVEAGGTAASAEISGIKLAGKTGTAQNPHGPDHGWFVGFAPAEKPKVVIAVMLEHGLHGSHAARIAATIIEHYLKARVIAPPIAGN